MGEVGAAEIVPSASIHPDVRSAWKDAAMQSFEEFQQQKPWWHEKIQIDLDKDPVYGPITKAVENNLKTKYLGVGVDEDKLHWPEVFIANPKNLEWHGDRETNSGEAWGLKNKVEIYPLGGESLLLDIKTIHHEIDHGLGRAIGVIRPENVVLKGVQQGFHRTPFSGVNLGEVLEEGVVEHYATMFTIDSNDDICVEARKNFAKKIAKDKKLTDVNLDDYKIRELCLQGIEASMPARHREAKNLVASLVQEAERIDPEQARMMEADLLRTRIDTNRTKIIKERMDAIFGEGTFREILHLDFNNPDGVKEFVERKIKKVDSTR